LSKAANVSRLLELGKMIQGEETREIAKAAFCGNGPGCWGV